MQKHLKEGLKLLGSDYTIKNIDFEDCIYRKLNDLIDFEISHCKKGYTVFVWQLKPRIRVLETVPELEPIKLHGLKKLLDGLEDKYNNITLEDLK